MIMDDSLNPIKGTCDSKECTNLSTTFLFLNIAGGTELGGCNFGDNLVCYPTSNYTKWTCYKNGYQCGTGCKISTNTNKIFENCDKCNQPICPSGMEYKDEKCITTNGSGTYCTTKLESNIQYCYTAEGERCAALTDIIETSGSCTDPGCKNGFTYAHSSLQNISGCINKEKLIECFPHVSYPPAICYYNGEVCGYKCDYDGTNCQTVILPQCASTSECINGEALSDRGCTCNGNVFIDPDTKKEYCCDEGQEYKGGKCRVIL